MINRVLGLALIAAALGPSSSLATVTLGPPSGAVTAYDSSVGTPSYGSGVPSAVTESGEGSEALAYTRGYRGPVAAAYTVTGTQGSLDYAKSYLQYAVGIGGPPYPSVPVTVQGELATHSQTQSESGTYPYLATTGFDTLTIFYTFGEDFQNVPLLSFEACSGGGCSLGIPNDVLFSDTIDVPSGATIYVQMSALAQSYGVNAEASASGDPYFQIDSSFDLASDFSIVTSPGIGNVPEAGLPGIPEPTTWAMMLVGFGGLGAAMRSRRRSAASARAHAS